MSPVLAASRTFLLALLSVLVRPRQFFRDARWKDTPGLIPFWALTNILLQKPWAYFPLRQSGLEPIGFAAARLYNGSFAAAILLSVGLGVIVSHGLLRRWTTPGPKLREVAGALGLAQAPNVLDLFLEQSQDTVWLVAISTLTGLWCCALLWIALKHGLGATSRQAVGLFAAQLLVGGVTSFACFISVAEAYRTTSGSMAPTLLIEDHAIAGKHHAHEAFPSDVVVFNDPVRHQKYIKRVVAVGGDEVRIAHNILTINGKPAVRCFVGEYVKEAGSYNVWMERLENGTIYLVEHADGIPPSNFGPFVVPKGEVFVLGDSRDESADSRSWGDDISRGVPLSSVVAPILGVYSPGEQPLPVSVLELRLREPLKALAPQFERCRAELEDRP